MHRFTGDSDDSQLYRAGEVMALMEISKQKGEESALDKAEKLARLTAFRWFASGALSGSFAVIIWKLIA